MGIPAMGDRVRDVITGFEGVVVGRCEYLTGCTQLGVSPSAKDGKLESTQWLDDSRLEVIGPSITLPQHAASRPDGCDVHPDRPSGRI